MDSAIVLLSGGVDSAVALWWAKARGWSVRTLTFDYFGRPRREHAAIEALSARARVAPPVRVDLPFLKEVDDLRKEGLRNPALEASPEGYIPARNLIFYSLAAYHAELAGTRYLVGGHNGVDPEAFPGECLCACPGTATRASTARSTTAWRTSSLTSSLRGMSKA